MTKHFNTYNWVVHSKLHMTKHFNTYNWVVHSKLHMTKHFNTYNWVVHSKLHMTKHFNTYNWVVHSKLHMEFSKSTITSVDRPAVIGNTKLARKRKEKEKKWFISNNFVNLLTFCSALTRPGTYE